MPSQVSERNSSKVVRIYDNCWEDRIEKRDTSMDYGEDIPADRVTEDRGNCKGKRAHISLAEVRRIYSLHSFRVTATNLLMAAGAPPHLRKVLGRWSSDSGMETYTREEMEEMRHFMKQQSKQLAASLQLPGAAAGVMAGGRLQGISRSPGRSVVVFRHSRHSQTCSPSEGAMNDPFFHAHDIATKRTTYQTSEWPRSRPAGTLLSSPPALQAPTGAAGSFVQRTCERNH